MSLLRHRSGAGEPVVLIHGIASSWRDWKPLLPYLEPRFDALAVALPGHFDGPAFPAGVAPGLAALGDALERELDRLGLSAALVAGSSLGGWLAFDLARRGRARAVVAFAPAGMWTAEEARALERAVVRNHRIARLFSPLSPLIARSRLAARIAFSGRVREPARVEPEEIAHKLRAFAGCPAFREILADMCSRSADRLQEVRCPVLAFWGEDDRLLPVRQAERLRRTLPDAEVVVMPRVGHLPMWDEPELAAAHMARFAQEELGGVAGR